MEDNILVVSVEDLYNSFIKNENPESCLTNFIKHVENFNSKTTEYDMVKNYLQISGNCKEILQLIKDISKLDSKKVCLLMDALCHILIRVAGDLHVFVSVGTSIVNEILSYGLGTIFNFLKFRQKSSRIKATLHLLSSMIAIGGQTAHQVVSKIDFSHITFTHLLNRKNFSENEDIRTTFINFVILVMTTCNFTVLRQLVEIKGFFSDILLGLISDRTQVILSVLSTFQKLIVQNSSIRKGSKLRLFSDQCLESIIKLYTWKGPRQTRQNLKRKLGLEEQPVAYEVSVEEYESVQKCAHEFMLSLCTSFETGIIFHDSLFGTSGKNVNYTLTKILKCMPKPHTNKLAKEFVISVLKICPDQLNFYWPCLEDSFKSRLSLAWVDVLNVINEIIYTQDPVSCLFNNKEKKSLSSLMNIAKSLCLPNIITPSKIREIFKEGQSFICYHICSFLKCILSQIKKVIDHCVNADFSQSDYSTAEISTFTHSFSSTVMEIFSFIENIEEYWGKVISKYVYQISQKRKSENACFENEIELFAPFSDQLLRILDVFQLYNDISQVAYHHYVLDVPKMFQNFKECQSLLIREEICKINIKIVDMIAAQSEQIISIWSKNPNNSLMVLFDIYIDSPSTEMIEDISNILRKMLLHTRVFDFCLWEMDIWLESMESLKVKKLLYIVEFISESMYNLLQNPNMFVEDMIENALGKCNSQCSLDITSILNDISSDDKDHVLMGNYEHQDVLNTEKQYFSSLIPAALFTLGLIDDRKRKCCQKFVENILYHVIHHQQTPEVLFSTIQKYKSSVSCNLYHYLELLCRNKFTKMEIENEDDDALKCKIDLSDHLKMKFLTMHKQSSMKGCHCDLLYDTTQLKDNYKEKIIWQLLSYIDLEINLICEGKIEEEAVLDYLNLFENLINSLGIKEELMETCKTNIQNGNKLFDIVEEILSRPIMLKLFLWTEKVPKSKKPLLKSAINCITKLVLNLINMMNLHVYNKILLGYKEKVIRFISFSFQTANLPKNTVVYENSDICCLISIFTSAFSSFDVTDTLENLLNNNLKHEDPSLYSSTLLLLFNMYIKLKDFIPIYPKTINSLLDRYLEMKEIQNNMRECIIQLFENHPILVSSVTVDSCCALLKQNLSENFHILGTIIDNNDQLRQAIQLIIIEDLETLKISPAFIFLVSKCVLNSALNEVTDIHFEEAISPYFWKAVADYITIYITSPDKLLESCGAGKALQILLQRNIISVEELNKFFRRNEDVFMNSVPSASNMLVLLQLIEIMRTYMIESNEFALSILKLVFHWLLSVIQSYQSASEFGYAHLLQFTFNLFQNMPDIDLKNFVDSKSFFSQILKIALRHETIGTDLVKILNVLCEKSKDYSLPAKSIFNLVTGHSNFFNIMLSDAREHEKHKECVSDLLITLVNVDTNVCKDNHLGLILSSYTGTLKSVDRKLLYLVKLYSESDIDIMKFSPFLWSKYAVAHYSVMTTGAMNLWKKPKLQDLLNIFSSEKIETTAEKYPLYLKLDPSISNSCEELENCTEVENIYDLRFFLPLFANVLSPGSFVHCHSFMNSRVLILIFTSLSSFDPNTRALGYYCLSQLYYHLESSHYRDKQMWMCLLESLRNSITSENPRIPSIVSLFLSKATHIFLKSDHPLFTVLYKFIMVKPFLDITHVPEFYKLFNSIEIEHTVQRLWLLRLLVDGLRSSLDFHICEKRYIFRILLTHYSSSLSSPQEKVEILNIIAAAVKIDSSAYILIQNALLVWLHKAIVEIDFTDASIKKSFCILLKDLWLNIKKFCKKSEIHNQNNENNKKKTKGNMKILYDSVTHEFQLVLLGFLKNLRYLDISSLKSYLSTLYDVMTFNSNAYKKHASFDQYLEYIVEFLESWKQLDDKVQQEEVKSAMEALDNISDFKQCSILLSKIILICCPIWKRYTSKNYHRQVFLVIKAIQRLLQFHVSPDFYTSALPIWLYKCFKEDEENALVRVILSSTNGTYLKLILSIFEQSFNVQSQFSSTKTDVYLCPESKMNVTNHWKKILYHFKEICQLYHLTPELTLYHQMIEIL